MKLLCNDSDNASLCDGTFQIGTKEQQFNVVKSLFAVQSNELSELLQKYNDTAVVIQDIAPNAFVFLREYFYGLNPVIVSKNISDVLYAAQKFKINPLLKALKQHISAIKDLDEIISILSGLYQYKLSEICKEIITSNEMLQNQTSVILSDSFKKLPAEFVIELLKSDELNLSEETIFEKCVTWAKYQVEIAQINDNASDYDEGKVEETNDKEKRDWKCIIQPLLPFIRFPIMDGGYFASKVMVMKLLSNDDSALIMQYILGHHDNKSLTFNTKLRDSMKFNVCYDQNHIANNGRELKISKSVTRLYGSDTPLTSGYHKFTVKCIDAGQDQRDGIGIMIDVSKYKNKEIWFDDSRVAKAFVWAQYGTLWKFAKGEYIPELQKNITVWKTGDTIRYEIDLVNLKVKCFLNGSKVAEGNIDREKQYYFGMAVRDKSAHYKLIKYDFCQ